MSRNTEAVGAFNVRSAAKYIGVSAPTLLKLIHDTKEIPHKRVGKRVIVPKAALDAWLETA
ncbi:MAG: excisionase family DNA-binding protein [Trueperaceae bacterium]